MHQKAKLPTKAGFTMVELLVVIFIIGLLASILLPALFSVYESGRKKSSIAEIQQLQVALSLYEEDYRDYPPSMPEAVGITPDNKINGGAEVLVACLSRVSKGKSYCDFTPQKLQNHDNDRARSRLSDLTGSALNSDELFEFVDPWDNPYIYFHNRDLLGTTSHFYTIVGEKTAVSPDTTSDKTGHIKGAGRYQIFSVGVDGTPSNEDDVYCP